MVQCIDYIACDTTAVVSVAVINLKDDLPKYVHAFELRSIMVTAPFSSILH